MAGMRAASRSGIAVAGIAACMVIVSGCGARIATSLLLKHPPSEQMLSRLVSWDRHGVACRIPLARVLSLRHPGAEKENRSYADGIARAAFLPFPREGGLGVRAVMVFSAFNWVYSVFEMKILAASIKNPLVHWIHLIPEGSDCIDVLPKLKLQTLLDIRRGSPFFRVAKARYGGTECTAVTDCVPFQGKLYRTVELYSGDPRTSPRPDHVLVAYVADKYGTNWGPGPIDAFAAGGKVFRMRPLDWGESGPSEIVFDEFSLKFDDIIDDKVGFLAKAMGQRNAITYLNNFLLEWKTRGMPDRLRAAKVAELESLVIRIEKAVLRYDMVSKRVKDEAAAMLAKGADASGRLEVARLTEQHVDILASILDVTKRVLAAKRKAP